MLIGAAAAGERARVYEAAVLKTLGASARQILASLALRAALIGAAAGLVAMVAGGVAGWWVTTFVMEGGFPLRPGGGAGGGRGGALASACWPGSPSRCARWPRARRGRCGPGREAARGLTRA